MAKMLGAIAPEITPAGNIPGGIFSALDIRDNSSQSIRWENGIVLEGNGSFNLGTFGSLDCDVTDEFELHEGVDSLEFEPFSVYGTFKCSPVGFTEQTATSRAISRLTQFEEVAVERTVWERFNTEGNSLQAKALTSDEATIPSNLELETALGILEHYLYANFGGGVIHVPRHYVDTLGSVNLAGTRMTLDSGVQVVFGAGYGKPGESKTIVATPRMIAYRSDIETPFNYEQAFDRAHNLVQVVASRYYVIGIDPVGSPVSLTLSA